MTYLTIFCIITACLAVLGVAAYLLILKLWPAKKVVPVVVSTPQPNKTVKTTFVATVVAHTYNNDTWRFTFENEDREAAVDSARELIHNLDKAMSANVAVYRFKDVVFRLKDISCIKFDKDSASYLSEIKSYED
jgi:hypothetical protein